ncbi:hypothetical protein FHR70_004632 [Microvirga lupini]|uniref:DUF6894 domain-containing protein n=1 Tax=Microvirga lupini TaxID=420324 RepID=A0A7W4YYV2_9HYPH|nr:hypothetical protein [Microvirga lupini]MBB3021531.1 hypothetical protein [Microvirga lupini]
MTEQISIIDGLDKLLATARQFELLADPEAGDVRKTAPVQGSRSERPSPESRSTTTNRAVPLGHPPRYFFDTDDGDRFIPDEIGLEVADLAAAREMACRALWDMARNSLTCGDPREFSVRVRDETGDVVLQARLSFAMDDRAKAQEQGRS